jgi:hypothetical protein
MSEEQQPVETEIIENDSTETVDQADDESEGDVSYSFDDVKPSDESEQEQEVESAPQWVKDMRKRDRENTKRLKALELENERLKQPIAAPVIELGAEPDPLDFDIWEDEGKQRYKVALNEYNERKTKIESEQSSQTAEREKVREVYATQVKELKAADYAGAESRVSNALDSIKQGLLLEALDNAPRFVIALDRDPERLEELSKIKSPVAFVKAIVKLEGKLTMSRTKSDKPAPVEHKLSGGASTSGGDSALNKLYAAAQKSGDYSAYHAAKRKTK